MNPLAIIGWITKLSGFVTGIDFNAVGNFLKLIADSMVKYWYIWLIGLMLVSNSFTGWELKHTRDNLKAEVAAHIKDINDFKTAQAKANEDAKQIQDTLIKRSQDDATKADSNYNHLLAQYRASLVRFNASQSGSKQAGDSQFPSAQNGNGPGADTNLSKGLMISMDDAQICAVNTARLQSVHDWAISLQKEVSQ